MSAEKPQGKWLEGIAPDDTVGAAAGASLRARLAAVRYYLPLAAQWPAQEVEDVHQVRVFTRRTSAALDLYKDWLPDRRRRQLAKQLKRIRKSAGDARDLDVLIARLESRQKTLELDLFLQGLRLRRAKAQQAVVETYQSLKSDEEFDKRIDELLERVRPRGKSGGKNKVPRFADWAAVRLRKFVKRFFKSAVTKSSDLDRLHEFRIRGKELRYAMELLAPAFPKTFREDLYPVVEKLQDKLGQINDHASARRRFEQWLENATSDVETGCLEMLLEGEAQQLETDYRAFFKWWTDDRRKDLQRAFEDQFAPAPDLETA